MVNKHSASLEMLSYLKSYAAKRAERKGTESIAAPKSYESLSYEEKIKRLERKLERLQAQKKADILALADGIVPKKDNAFEALKRLAA